MAAGEITRATGAVPTFSAGIKKIIWGEIAASCLG